MAKNWLGCSTRNKSTWLSGIQINKNSNPARKLNKSANNFRYEELTSRMFGHHKIPHIFIVSCSLLMDMPAFHNSKSTKVGSVEYVYTVRSFNEQQSLYFSQPCCRSCHSLSLFFIQCVFPYFMMLQWCQHCGLFNPHPLCQCDLCFLNYVFTYGRQLFK